MKNDINLDRLAEVQATISGTNGPGMNGNATSDWSSPPKDLPPPLPSVPSLNPEMIPKPLRAWLEDGAERMQVSLEFMAAPALTALSILVGRRIGIRPKARDDWTVVPNLWGGIVARPGYMKSPALKAALKPLDRLIAKALEKGKGEVAEKQAKIGGTEAAIDGIKSKIKSDTKKGVTDHSEEESKLQDLCSTLLELRREEAGYHTNDTTIEKLVMLLESRPSGILVLRDELTGWLKNLDKAGRESDRSFFLESWNGDGRYVVNRVSRASNHVEGLCLSVLGGIQPGRLSEYIQSAVMMGAGDDGLIQRFQLAVFPDESPKWENIDRYANVSAKNEAFKIFEKLSELDFTNIVDVFDDSLMPCVRFQPEAQNYFDEWLLQLETRLRSQSTGCPAFESHLAKYRSLMPSLALLFQAIEFAGGASTTMAPSKLSVLRAIDWCTFLEEHAKKIYAIVLNPHHHSSSLLADKIKAGHVKDGMSVRELYRHHWRLLDTPEKVEPALLLLEELDWLKVVEKRNIFGRASEIIRLNPALMRFPGGAK